MEQKVSTTSKALQAVFGAMPRSRIALDTGTHSPWISRLLSELGHEVIVYERAIRDRNSINHPHRYETKNCRRTAAVYH
jgi:hypothetical protein